MSEYMHWRLCYSVMAIDDFRFPYDYFNDDEPIPFIVNDYFIVSLVSLPWWNIHNQFLIYNRYTNHWYCGVPPPSAIRVDRSFRLLDFVGTRSFRVLTENTVGGSSSTVPCEIFVFCMSRDFTELTVSERAPVAFQRPIQSSIIGVFPTSSYSASLLVAIENGVWLWLREVTLDGSTNVADVRIYEPIILIGYCEHTIYVLSKVESPLWFPLLRCYDIASGGMQTITNYVPPASWSAPLDEWDLKHTTHGHLLVSYSYAHSEAFIYDVAARAGRAVIGIFRYLPHFLTIMSNGQGLICDYDNQSLYSVWFQPPRLTEVVLSTVHNSMPENTRRMLEGQRVFGPADLQTFLIQLGTPPSYIL